MLSSAECDDGASGSMLMSLVSIATDGGWSSWTEWSKPSSTCGNDGFQSRTRKCDNPTPANNGRNCHGVPIETKLVPLPRCGQ